MPREQIIKCDSCSFAASDFCCSGRFVYAHQNPHRTIEIGVGRRTGWCMACETIRAIETLEIPSSTESAPLAAVKKAEALKDQIAVMQSQLNSPPKGIWERLSLKSTIESRRAELNKAEENLAAAIRLIETKQMTFRAYQVFYGSKIQIRKARCLECGTTDHVYLSLPPVSESATPFVPIGFRHPDCGGQLGAISTGAIYNLVLEKCIYSPAGDLLHKERIPSR
jgi:hypothetical protein